jgi:hypothetical protein
MKIQEELINSVYNKNITESVIEELIDMVDSSETMNLNEITKNNDTYIIYFLMYENAVVYIGKSVNQFYGQSRSRYYDHVFEKMFDHVKIISFEDAQVSFLDTLITRIESVYINIYNPYYNKAGVGFIYDSFINDEYRLLKEAVNEKINNIIEKRVDEAWEKAFSDKKFEIIETL